MLKLNLIVIRTKDPEILKSQYEQLGFVFDYHQHGNGPFHYASEKDGFVYEIYPLTKSMEKADSSLRLGFEVENIKDTIDKIKETNWNIISEITDTEWGLIAIVQDLDGRKIELKQKTNAL